MQFFYLCSCLQRIDRTVLARDADEMDVHLLGNLYDPFLLQQCRKHRLRHPAPGYLPEHRGCRIGRNVLRLLLVPIGQRILRPTVATMYNYVQPIIASIITVIVGLDTFGLMKSIAIALVFLGVYIVTRSKSKEQLKQLKGER